MSDGAIHCRLSILTLHMGTNKINCLKHHTSLIEMMDPCEMNFIIAKLRIESTALTVVQNVFLCSQIL